MLPNDTKLKEILRKQKAIKSRKNEMPLKYNLTKPKLYVKLHNILEWS